MRKNHGIGKDNEDEDNKGDDVGEGDGNSNCDGDHSDDHHRRRRPPPPPPPPPPPHHHHHHHHHHHRCHYHRTSVLLFICLFPHVPRLKQPRRSKKPKDNSWRHRRSWLLSILVTVTVNYSGFLLIPKW